MRWTTGTLRVSARVVLSKTDIMRLSKLRSKMPSRVVLRAAVTAVAVAIASSAHAESVLSQLKDADDGWLDASNYLLDNERSFLPVPIIITEPALEGGLGLAGVFFHRRPESQTRASDEFERPSVSALAMGYTGNESWFAGGGHVGRWRRDTIQYTGGGGLASINMEYYGSDTRPIDSGADFNADGFFLMQEMLFRLNDSNWMLGARWQFMQTEVAFDLGVGGGFGSDLDSDFGLAGIEPIELDFQDSGLGAVLEYDNLDSTFTPNSGNHLHLEARWHAESLGGDFDYQNYRASYLHFVSLGKVVVAGRIQADHVDGFAPFFVKPFVDLRGIPAMRYQGNSVATVELETRWDFHPRVSAVGFIGAGRASDTLGELSDANTRTSVGIGIRYLMAKLLGLRVGIDIARGPDDTAFYLTVGHNWDT